MTQVEETTEDNDQQDPGASYWAGRRGPDRNDMVASYLPESDDWGAKTLLDLNDPGRVAALRQFGAIFPEVDDLQPMIDDFLDEFLKDKTSIAGRSRDDYQRIYESMFGGHPAEKHSPLATVSAILAADEED